MTDFIYESLPARVIFGTGTREQLPAEIDRLGAARALVLTTPEQAKEGEAISAMIGSRGVASFHKATMHTPVPVTEEALAVLVHADADVIVAIGGGSTVGLSKALALRTDLPQIVLPTTYAGSEMTPILGQTENGVKTTVRCAKVLPEVVLYDIALSRGLPLRSSINSGLNAIAHAAEALYAKDGNPVLSIMAEASIAAFARSLPVLVQDPGDLQARRDALYGAWLAGSCLAAAGMALHHKLCHTLGGTFDLPHAETHAVVLPYAMAFNRAGAPDAMAAIARALKTDDAPRGLRDLARSLGAPLALGELGFAVEDVGRAVEIAVRNPYWNPVAIDAAGIDRLLRAAQSGDEDYLAS